MINNHQLEFKDVSDANPTKHVLCVVGNVCQASDGSYNTDFMKDHCFKEWIGTNSDKKMDENKYDKLLSKDMFGMKLNSETENIIFGNYLKRKDYYLSLNESKNYALNIAKDNTFDYNNELHCGILLNFMNNIIDDTFPYYPAIHYKSQLQFVNKDKCGSTKAGQTFKTYGKLVKYWINPKNGFRFGLLHALVCNQNDDAIALSKHWFIYDLENKGVQKRSKL